MTKGETMCDICCRPKARHIGRDLQCPETVYFREMPRPAPDSGDRNAVLEEAARMAEQYPSLEMADVPVIRGIAKAIRSLKSTEPLTIGEDGLVGAIDAAMTDLDLLRSAIEKSDPQRELLIRTTDIWRRLNEALRNQSLDRGEG